MKKIVSLLKALSDNTRYKIISMLLYKNYCVRSLSKKLNISESAVSQQLKILKRVNLVECEKRGYFTHYRVNRHILVELSNELINLSEKKFNSEEDNECCVKEGK
ncbi:MAG: ArsR/SmtB family transcription factor [Clostridia bacterium]